MPNALLVVDMLRGFLENGHNLFCGEDARKIIPTVKALLDQEISEGSKVFYICDAHQPNDLEFDIFPEHCLEGTLESQVIPELVEYPGIRVNKNRYSGFYGTELGTFLEDLLPEKVIVCGVCTDICVLHTVADARNRDYQVEVRVDSVASFDLEAHSWALDHMEHILGAKLVRT